MVLFMFYYLLMKTDRKYYAHKNLITYAGLNSPKTFRDLKLKYQLDDISLDDTSHKDNQIKEQKSQIKLLTESLTTQSKEQDKTISTLTQSLYHDLTTVNNQMTTLTAMNQSLQSENNQLKEIIDKKDILIAQFEEIAKETSAKLGQIEIINRKEDKDKVKIQMDGLFNEIIVLETQNDEAMKKIHQLNLLLNQLTNEKNNLIERMNDHHCKSMQDNEELVNKCNYLENENEALIRQNDNLKIEVNELRRYAGNFQKEKNKAFACNDQLQLKIKEYTKEMIKLRDKVNEYQLERKVLLMKVKDYERHSSNLQTRSNTYIMTTQSDIS